LTDELCAVGSCAEIAAIKQDVGGGAQMRLPLRELRGVKSRSRANIDA
jgi:hypothetical protein